MRHRFHEWFQIYLDRQGGPNETNYYDNYYNAAWIVSMGAGNMGGGSKVSGSIYVWPVRSAK